MTEKYTNDPDAAAERLDYLAQFEGTEMGETWRLLASLWLSYRDYVSPELAQVLEQDIIDEAERVDSQYKIVEKEYPVMRKSTELKYIGE